MAIEIISEEPDPRVVKEAVCFKCGVKLRYLPIDVQIRHYKDYDGSSDSFEFIPCPRCSNEVKVR